MNRKDKLIDVLPVRQWNILAPHFDADAMLCDLALKKERELRAMKNMGQYSMRVIKSVLAHAGLTLNDSPTIYVVCVYHKARPHHKHLTLALGYLCEHDLHDVMDNAKTYALSLWTQLMPYDVDAYLIVQVQPGDIKTL